MKKILIAIAILLIPTYLFAWGWGGGGGSSTGINTTYDADSDSKVDADKVATLNQNTTGKSASTDAIKSGTTAARPATCTENQVYWETDGNCFNICTATNTWTQIYCVGADGSFRIALSNNTAVSPTASAYEIYADATIWKLNENGTEYRIAKVIDAAVIDDADNFDDNFTGNYLYGGTFIANAAGTIVLPNPAIGMHFTIVLEGANAVIIDPLGTGTADAIIMNGLAAADDENITSSTSGAMCIFQYRSADHWMATCNGFAEATPP